MAGSAGGRRLSVPAGRALRPTSERVREGLFSALESARGGLAGMRFLDLYAGSGAVGLEALSRGAAHATLVEKDRRTAAAATANARALTLSGADVVVADAAVLVRTPPAGPAYDVVFLDPPYAVAAATVDAIIADLVRHGWLAERADVVAERSVRDPGPTWANPLEATRDRRYGDTVLWYGRRP